MRGPLGAVALAAIIASIGAIPRVLLAADVLPDWLRPFTWTDLLSTWERGISGGRLPYWDTYFEYPPLFGYLAGALSRVSPSAAAYVAAWALVQIVAATAVAAVLVREVGARRALRWALAPQLLLYGSLNVEVLVVAMLVAGVIWERRSRTALASVALALGAATKLFPAAALPIFLVRRWRAGGRPLALASASIFALVVAGAYAPSLAAPFSSSESIGRYAAGIEPNFDSLWGLARSALVGIGVPEASRWILIATLGGLAVTYVVGVLPSAGRTPDPAIGVGLAVVALLFWTRLYSPQFSLWILPFFALLPLSTRSLATLTAADIIVFFTVYPLTLARWPSGDTLQAGLASALAAAVVLRHVALVLVWRDLVRLERSGRAAAP